MIAAQGKFPHIIGTEVEHDIHDPVKGESGYTPVVASTVSSTMACRGVRFGLVNSSRNVWARNGSRFYPDANSKAEAAGPECRNGTQAMRYETGGSLAWACMARATDRAKGRPATTWVLKTNSSTGGASSGGYHVSVSMPASGRGSREDLDDVAAQLSAYVSTSRLMFGSGVVLPTDYGNTLISGPAYRYAISPRGLHVEDEIGAPNNSTGVGKKQLFMSRDEPLADKLRFWRFQTCGYDSNVLPAATQLKLDIHLLLSEMAAVGALKPITIAFDVDAGRPHPARRVSLNWQKPLETEEHGSLTPLDIQRRYFRQLEEYLAGSSRGRSVLHQWDYILRQFESGETLPKSLFGLVDWVTKALMLERAAARQGKPLTYKAAENRHFLYHGYRLRSGEVCTPIRLLLRFGPPGIYRQIWREILVPPSDTRASARGRLIAAKPTGVAVDWDKATFGTDVVRLPDPSEPSSPQFEAFMETFTNKPEQSAA